MKTFNESVERVRVKADLKKLKLWVEELRGLIEEQPNTIIPEFQIQYKFFPLTYSHYLDDLMSAIKMIEENKEGLTITDLQILLSRTLNALDFIIWSVSAEIKASGKTKNECPVCGEEVSWNDDQVYLAGVFYHYECFKKSK
jgi:predicted RNA-binding Zn-ribbon protein involved in translation (DUF1610 family)